MSDEPESQSDSLNVICPYCEASYQCEAEDFDEEQRDEECFSCKKTYVVWQEFDVTHRTEPKKMNDTTIRVSEKEVLARWNHPQTHDEPLAYLLLEKTETPHTPFAAWRGLEHCVEVIHAKLGTDTISVSVNPSDFSATYVFSKRATASPDELKEL